MKFWISFFGLALLSAQATQSQTAPATETAAAPAAAAATIHLKDGTTILPSAMRRSGGNVMITVPAGEIGKPVASIQRIDFPAMPQLAAATDLLSQGKSQEALTQIEPVLSFYQPYVDIPGNQWAQAALVKLNALNALGRNREADALTLQLSKASNDPELLQLVQVRQAKDWIAKGQPEKALAICDEVIGKSKSPDTLAYAWLNKGLSLSAQQKWEPAALAYLHVPVFFEKQKLLVPQALLGAARAIAAFDEKGDAEKRYQELIDTFPSSPEAETAKDELMKLHL